MNDEDFARHEFAAFRSGATGEPPTLPDVERLATRARRAARNRHGAYAAGTTALAGVVTVGVVAGPALLRVGTASPTVTAAGGGGTSSAAPHVSATVHASEVPAKPTAFTCSSAPTIDWLGVVSPELPSGVTAVVDHTATCIGASDHSRELQALFTLSTGVDLQVTVDSGAVGVPGPAATFTPSIGPDSTVASSDGGPGSATPTPTPTATTSGDHAATPCTPIGFAAVCGGQRARGIVMSAQVVRKGASPLVVKVMASNNAGGASSPLPDNAFVAAVAAAVAAHF